MKNQKTTPNQTTDISEYLLYNVANYKSTINYSIQEIVTKFITVIIDYMRFISEKITMKNKKNYKFIFERGIETIMHIFSIIFLYTKNLELTAYHSQKGYYFYIEFIEQISDENVTFLQLSSRDALLFVYKKTIFDLNNEYKKNIKMTTLEETKILTLIDSYKYIYKTIVHFIINNKNFNYVTKKEYINKCCDYIASLGDTLNKLKMKNSSLECVHLFSNIFIDKPIDIELFFKLLNEFILKINNKKKIEDKIINNKIYEIENNYHLFEDKLDTLINWIFA